MKTPSIQELKQELSTVKPKELMELCLRLARFKKENKELLTYLLFEAQDEQGYIESVKKEMEDLFATINLSHLYFAKKTLRKILRMISKHTRYTKSRQAEVEWLLHFCGQIRKFEIPYQQSPALNKIYLQQLKKIHLGIDSLHEDLQYDYRKAIEEIEAD